MSQNKTKAEIQLELEKAYERIAELESAADREEEKLRQSEARVQATLNAIPDMMFRMSRQGSILDYRADINDLYGQTGSLVGKPIKDSLPLELVRLIESNIAVTLDTNQLQTFEYYLDLPMVGRREFEARMAPSETDEVITIVRDITERKQVEKNLHASEEHYRMLAENMTDIIWLSDMSMRTVYISPSLTRLRGFTLEEMNELPSDQLIAPESLERAMRLFAEYTAPERLAQTTGPISASIDLEYFKKDGSSFWCENTFTLIRNENGVPTHILGAGRDISERRRAERELRESEAKYRSLIDSQDSAISTIDAGGVFHYINGNGAAPFGTPDFVVGKTLHELFPPPIADWQLAQVRQVIATGQGLVHEYKGQVAGHPSWRRVSIQPIHYAGSSIKLATVNSLDITERKRVEEELRESETRYQQFISLALEAISRTEFDHPIDTSLPVEEQIDRIYENAYLAECNQALADMYHTTVETMIGMRMVDAHGGKDNPVNREAFRKFIAAGYQSTDNETAEFTADGKPVWFQSNTVGVVQDGKLVRLWETAMDITKRKRAEAALRASEDKYRGLMESLDSVVATVDANGTFLYMNDQAASSLEANPTDLIGKTMYGLFPRELAERQMTSIRQVIGENRPTVFESQTLVHGRLRWYRTSIQPVHDESGQVSHVLINTTDIDDIKSAQRELEVLNRTLEEKVNQRTAEVQDLYDHAPVGYHSISVEGCLVAINQTELDWLGYSREELIGKPARIIVSPENAQSFDENFELLKATGKLSNLETRALRKNKTTFPVMINTTAIYDESGQYVSSRSTMTDITQRKQAEDALRLANAELERAIRIKDEFLASMSHELRTPLNAILGLSESMIEQFIGPLNERQLQSMQTIEASGRHLLELINDILDLSKLAAGQVALELTVAAVRQVCETSLMFIKEMARKKNIRVTSTLDPDVTYVQADERRLKQMLINLLSNAVKFTPQGGTIELKVTGNLTNQTVSFSVSDTGIGIASEDLPRLFQPFVQLDGGLNRQFEGTGLGLSLVARMAKLHGGSVSVETDLGRGSRFTIVLPWKSPQVPSAAAAGTQNSPSAVDRLMPPLAESGGPLILIAEDNETNIISLSLYLQAVGYRVAVARNGIEALEQARLRRPALILMDLQMPVLNGLEATRRLRQESEPQIACIPVIALTALAMPADRARSLEGGANEYLSKPVNLKKLTEVINHLIKEHR